MTRAKKPGGLADPTRLAPTDENGLIVVIIETPKGNRNKYAFDPEERVFALKKLLPAGMAFPYDFGFVLPPRAVTGILWMCWCSWMSRHSRGAS